VSGQRISIEVDGDRYGLKGRTVLGAHDEEIGIIRDVAHTEVNGFVLLLETNDNRLKWRNAEGVRLRPIPTSGDDGDETGDFSAENAS
jgi:hypothetical protein